MNKVGVIIHHAPLKVRDYYMEARRTASPEASILYLFPRHVTSSPSIAYSQIGRASTSRATQAARKAIILVGGPAFLTLVSKDVFTRRSVRSQNIMWMMNIAGREAPMSREMAQEPYNPHISDSVSGSASVAARVIFFLTRIHLALLAI